jgi:hypothetical protein
MCDVFRYRLKQRGQEFTHFSRAPPSANICKLLASDPAASEYMENLFVDALASGYFRTTVRHGTTSRCFRSFGAFLNFEGEWKRDYGQIHIVWSDEIFYSTESMKIRAFQLLNYTSTGGGGLMQFVPITFQKQIINIKRRT